MRVLSVTMLFPGSATPGQGIFVKERLKHLPKDIDVTVLRLRPWFPLRKSRSEPPRFEVVDGLPVHDRRFFYWPGFAKHTDGHRLGRALERFLREWPGERFEVIDAHFTYPTGAGAVEAGRRAGIPVVVTERGTLPSYRHDGRAEPMARALRDATRCVAVSESLAAEMRSLAGASLDVRVIPNGVDGEVFRSGSRAEARRELGIDEGARVLLTVGGLVPRKGVARVLEVLPSLFARHPSLVYLVVGGGGVEGDHEAALRRRIAEIGCESRVRLEGPVDHEALPRYYRAADVFVLSSSNEGWANVLQESLACGTPCIATDVGGNREVVGGRDNGIIVPFGDAAMLRDALLEALARSWNHEIIAAFGRRRTWSAVGIEVAKTFEEAVDAR